MSTYTVQIELRRGGERKLISFPVPAGSPAEAANHAVSYMCWDPVIRSNVRGWRTGAIEVLP